jgi:hypothetical protein
MVLAAVPGPPIAQATVWGSPPDMRIGCFLSCEEFAPGDLVAQARRAEEAGFHALWISDHYHPWNDEQGHSPFVWSVIGAIAQVTDLPVTTGVTCPTVRIHPAIVAQAAATSNVLLEGRFSLGVGTGEALNEHVTTARWPNIDVRLDMLEEAVGVMRALWSGEYVSHHGQHYSVENARIYTRTEQPPPIYVSGFGPKSAELAGRIGMATYRPSPIGSCCSVSAIAVAKGSLRRPATRFAGAATRRWRSRPPTGYGRRRACPASCRKCYPVRAISNRSAHWLPSR